MHRRSPVHDVPSIAVLPFANRSRDPEDEYFADGLADELLNVLAKIRGLRVAARSSAFTFKNKGATVAEVGRALNVATILEGSVRKAGNRMRVSVQLVKVADGYQLWAESYDRTLDDIFAVQDDIALSVVKELRSTLLGQTLDPKAGSEATSQVATAVKGRSLDPEAYRLYLHGRHLIERLTRDDTAKGIEYLKAALDRDPAFALAWAELGRAYGNEVSASWAPLAEGPQRAREAVMRALALEPELAEAHAELAWIQMLFDWDWSGAETSCARALELAPGSAVMLRRAGDLASMRGRFDEAIALYRRAIERDPLSAAAHGNLGFAFDAAGRLPQAEQALRRALLLAPQRSNGRASLAKNLLAQGRNDEALAEALREPEEWARLWALAVIYTTTGRLAEAEAALRELVARHGDAAAYQAAEVYAIRGEVDRAFECLDRAYAARDPGLSSMMVEPALASLHADPRWGAFLRKMRLAD
jgi:TolB-like protein/Tfp pilus assembly protein PilF